LEYYFNSCRQGWIDQNKLFFDFGGDIFIVFSFRAKEGEYEDFYSFKSISLSDIEEFLENDILFSNLTLKGGNEQLDSRKYLSVARSITNEMFSFIRRINSFQGGCEVIQNYYTDIIY